MSLPGHGINDNRKRSKLITERNSQSAELDEGKGERFVLIISPSTGQLACAVLSSETAMNTWF